MRCRAVPLLAAAAAVSLLGACAARTPACASDTDCSRGHECLASRCRWLGSDPVRPYARRSVVEPSRMAVLGEPTAERPGLLPATVTLGAARGPRVRWLLGFDLPPIDELDSAFLLLEPTPDAPQDDADVTLQAWLVAEPWTPADVTVRDAPALTPPRATGIARGRPAAPVRLDVTEHARRWSAEPRRNHGLALEATSAAASGITLDTGAVGGQRPRLEIYAYTR